VSPNDFARGKEGAPMAVDDLDRAALFAAYRTAFAAPAERRDEVLARLHRADDRPVILAQPDERERITTLVRAVVLAVAAAVLAVLGLELMSGGLAASRQEGQHFEAVDEAIVEPEDATAVERGEALGAVKRRDGVRVATIVPAELPEPIEIPPPPLEVVAVPPADATAPAKATAPEVPAAPTETEPVLLARAHAAIERGAWARAKTALARHAERFPNGVHAVERQALQIVVDCRVEHSAQARLRARDFIVHHARTPQFSKIIAACKAATPTGGSSSDIVDPFGEPPATAE
ncbi:MAG TPA: hypothetical protein VG755_03035, partial [Nannocystaceae bacterium]|nr:hypothetical protein [Nannocystaceae bacterium]